MSKVDIHILHLPNEINILGDVNGTNIVPHHIEGIEGNIVQSRIDGFLCGVEEYVSYADPDDILYTDVLTECVSFLDKEPKFGGVYTNSLVFNQRQKTTRTMFPSHQWSVQYHRSCVVSVHQLVVIRRSLMEQAIYLAEQLIQEFYIKYSSNCFYIEHLLFAHVATLAPFKFIDKIGYKWFNRPTGNHAKFESRVEQETLHHIQTILTPQTIKW